ncbi:MAG: hypothetical protein ABR956_10610 [Terracidiphilus sp.]|jgi:hypothetical protein
MLLHKLLTPVVLSALLITQASPAVYAQQPAPQQAQPATQPAQQPAPQPAPQALSNDSVIKLVKAGLSDDLIVSTIANSPGAYDVSPDAMIALKSAGASDKVVSAIVSKSNAAAQPAPPPMPAAPPAPSDKFVLKEGTDVLLAFDEDLSSKTASEGDAVTFVLTEDVKVGDVVVAKKGAKAVGEVTNAKKSAMMGEGGELNIRLNFLKVGDAKVHLRGSKGKEGDSGLGGAIALTLLVGVFGLLHHGKDVKVQAGTALHAYVSDDISLPAAS